MTMKYELKNKDNCGFKQKLRCNVLFNLLCVLAMFGCAKKQYKADVKEAVISSSENYTNNEVLFIPDSTVNSRLFLNNRESARQFYSKISSEKLIERFKESPVLVFSSKSNEYLIVYQYEGAGNHEFSCFEIGDMKDLKDVAIIESDYNKFETESNLRLGLSFDQLKSIKGEVYKREGDKVIYVEDDYSNSNFLKRYNMPAYFLECTLKNDTIHKIKFGFEYP